MKFLVICGGTGGHVAPGIALAQRLIEKGHFCKLIISQKWVDSQMMHNYDLDYLQCPGAPFSIRPKGFFLFLKTFYQSLRFYRTLILTYEPDCIVGFGGFLTVGGVLAGYFSKIPCVLHEANRVVGRSIALLSGFCKCVYLPIGMHLKLFLPENTKYASYPVRQDIERITPETARIRLGFPEKAKILLVMGGSQGANSLTQWARKYMQKLGDKKIHLICLTGSKNADEIIHYKNEDGYDMQAQFRGFTHNISCILSACTLAVSRAGAGSIAELEKCHLPAILVPYPHAAANHQYHNALFAQKQGHAVLLPDKDLGSLFEYVCNFFKNPKCIQHIQKSLEEYTLEDSTEDLANDLVSMLQP